MYFGENLGAYVVVDTDRDEVDYVKEDGTTQTTRYSGDGGVSMGSFFRRAAFALRFGDINPLISNFITGESKILYVRDVSERVRLLAPFLDFDSDPYPVVVDGKLVWIIDAYTTTDEYPYAQRAVTGQLPPGSDLGHRFNYVRNSVKAVVDAYDGSVTFYVVDPSDPLDPGLPEGLPEPVHRRLEDDRRRCDRTCGTQRTCSACRPPCGAATTSRTQPSSTARAMRGALRRTRARWPAS